MSIPLESSRIRTKQTNKQLTSNGANDWMNNFSFPNQILSIAPF